MRRRRRPTNRGRRRGGDLDLLAGPEPDDVLLQHEVLAAVVGEHDHQRLRGGVLQGSGNIDLLKMGKTNQQLIHTRAW